MSCLLLFSLLASALGAHRFQILVGDDSMGFSFDSYFPSQIIVLTNDTITFIHNTNMPHTVTFGKMESLIPWNSNGTLVNSALPMNGKEINQSSYQRGVSSGIMPMFGNQEWTVKFTESGIYNYYCIFDTVFMTGTVVAKDSGTTLDPAQVEQEAKQQIKTKQDQIPYWRNQNQLDDTSLVMIGPKSYEVRMGWGNKTVPVSFSRFIPQTFTINYGDSITFINSDPTSLHTFTMNSTNIKEPTFIQNGTTLVLNPNFLIPTKPEFSGEFINSGLLATGSKFTVKFEHSGTFRFFCALHKDMNMIGQVTVRSSTTTGETTSGPTTGTPISNSIRLLVSMFSWIMMALLILVQL